MKPVPKWKDSSIVCMFKIYSGMNYAADIQRLEIMGAVLRLNVSWPSN